MTFVRFFLVIVVLNFSLPILGQSDKNLRYIEKYSDIAVSQMKKHKIPASITMAQGLLESGAGTSTLAVKGNNHFGIKCHNDWRGPYMLRTDDAPNEKFRVYKTVEDSYEDHSLFLVGRSRYSSLFSLSITDYRGWAYGLKAAGYATSSSYAANLIGIIEKYNLAELDKKGLTKHYHAKKYKDVASANSTVQNTLAGYESHKIGMNNHNYFVVAKPGDTYKSIANEFETSERKLRRYNEVSKRYVLKEGDIIYLHKKERKTHKSYKNKFYVLQSGESLHGVAQKFGVRLKTLYKINGYSPDHVPAVGERIKLR